MVMVLLVSIGVFTGNLLTFAIAMALIVHLLVRLIETGYTGRAFWKNVAIMVVVSLMTAATHVIEIALWALVFLMVQEFSTFESAFYFSAQNYTALGYGDIALSERWRLLGPLEAINGLLLFGLSTALMFAVLGRLITMRIQPQLGRLAAAETNDSQKCTIDSVRE